MKIAVYLGSTSGRDPRYTENANALGEYIGQHSHTLVYGGAGVGTMKTLADAVLRNAGQVIGVMPTFMIERGRAHANLTQLIEVSTMSERKQTMIELADLFIALPGGPGTLEEISEVISLVRLQQKEARCILHNLNGYYEPLKQMFQQMIDAGFLTQENADQIWFLDTLEEIEAVLA